MWEIVSVHGDWFLMSIDAFEVLNSVRQNNDFSKMSTR